MSSASSHLEHGAEPGTERLQRWIAALASALLHLLLLLLLLYASKPTMTAPAGAAGGSRMKVDFVGEAPPTDQPEHPPRSATTGRHPHPRPPRPRPPTATRVQSTLVAQARDPVPPPDARAAQQPPAPEQRPSEPQPDASPTPDEAAPSRSQATTASPPSGAQRHPETWTGRPPGMLDRDTARENAGMADSAAINRGNGRAADTSGPSMEVGGYQVYYDLHSETLLRSWKEQGMTEVYILLPGTDSRMVCPLEIALRRGSGKCRLLAPDSPELKAIGDARQVITMMDVYHQGERVWHGPGPYR